MTKSALKKKYESARKARNDAMSRVYASATHDTIPFSRCLEDAPEGLRADYQTACSIVDAIERDAVSAGYGYFEGSYVARFYWHEGCARKTIKRGK